MNARVYLHAWEEEEGSENKGGFRRFELGMFLRCFRDQWICSKDQIRQIGLFRSQMLRVSFPPHHFSYVLFFSPANLSNRFDASGHKYFFYSTIFFSSPSEKGETFVRCSGVMRETIL